MQLGLKLRLLLEILQVNQQVSDRLIPGLAVLAQRLGDNALEFLRHFGSKLGRRRRLDLKDFSNHITGSIALETPLFR